MIATRPTIHWQRSARLAMVLCGATCGAAMAQATDPSAVAPATAPASVPAADVPPASARDDGEPRNGRLRVADPYLELHTGPGRGFPVFFVAEREEWILVELRHTDWYKIRTASGRVGWVPRDQLARTLTEAGLPYDLGSVDITAFLQRKIDVGAGWARYKSNALTRGWLGYRFADTLSIEMDVAQVQSAFSSTNVWYASLLSEPWSDKRLSPFMGIGVGRFRYVPNQSLIDNEVVENKLAVATVGARYYLAGRVAVRMDYSMFTGFIADNRTRAYQAISVGLSVHF